MGTKNKKRKKSKVTLATAISRGTWKMNTSQEIEEERGDEKEAESILSDKKKIGRNTFYKIFDQWYKRTYIKDPMKSCFIFCSFCFYSC